MWVCLIWLPSSSQKSSLQMENLVPVTSVALLWVCWHQTNDSQFIPTWNKWLSAQKLWILTATTKCMTNWQLGKWGLGVSDDRNIFLSSLKIMTLKYLISRYEKTQIQIISLIGLPQIFPTNVPVLRSHVLFFTQRCHKRPEVDSLGQITQLCLWQLSEQNMSQGPTENKVFPSVKSAAVPGPKEVFPLIWFLWSGICQAFDHNSWPVLTASGKSSGQKLRLELFSLQDQMNSVWH